MAIWPYGQMALSLYRYNSSNIWVFFGNRHKNDAIWWRNLVDLTFLWGMRAKMVRWYIFLCIFRNFLCKRKQLWPLHKNALKLLNLFLLNNSLYGQNIAILTYDKVQDQAVCLLKATQKYDILVNELRILCNLEKCCYQNNFMKSCICIMAIFPTTVWP